MKRKIFRRGGVLCIVFLSLTMLLSSCLVSYPEISGNLYYNSSSGQVTRIEFTVTGGEGGPYNVWYMRSVKSNVKAESSSKWTYVGKVNEGETVSYYIPGTHYKDTGWYYHLKAVSADNGFGTGYKYWH